MSVVVIMIMTKDYGSKKVRELYSRRTLSFLSLFVPFPFRLPSFGSSLVNRRNRKGVIALHPLAFTAPPPLSLRTASLINCKTILTRNWRCNNAFSFIRLCSTRSARSLL